MDYETYVSLAATAKRASARRAKLIRDAYMSGLVMRQIAPPLGLTTSRVGKILKDQGLTRLHRGLTSTFSTEQTSAGV